MKPGRLVRAALRLTELLGEGSGLAGGLAVAAWGEIRATQDVDFATSRPLSEVEAALRAEGVAYTIRRGDLLSGDLPWVVSGELDGAHFQVFAPRGGRSFETVTVSTSGEPGGDIRVVDLPDLLRLKLEAGGPKDLWDVARLVRRHPDRRERAVEVAAALGLEAELQRWLDRE